MSFKEQLSQDILIFMNKDEFADTHNINGTDVICIVDSSNEDETNQYLKGTTSESKSIAIATSLLNGIPKPNDYLILDSKLFRVSKVSESLGMTYIDLTQQTGKFDKQISIYEAETVDKGGGWTETVIGDLFYQCNAYIRNQSGDEIFKSNTKLEVSQTLFKIPYVEGIEKSMILVYKGKHYDILHIDNVEENNVFIDLICEKVE